MASISYKRASLTLGHGTLTPFGAFAIGQGLSLAEFPVKKSPTSGLYGTSDWPTCMAPHTQRRHR
ncbi:MAG: hypothetical protein QY332_13010 [Anaerolineales bacterium]|nr:MAG: hypothetical protein QY332_13010 [Anaerolineales bacterium]